jgi:AcrR family transcriptional regulator
LSTMLMVRLLLVLAQPGSYLHSRDDRRELEYDIRRRFLRGARRAERTVWYMRGESDSREQLLDKVVAFAAREGIADRSLREIAAGVGTSHRMLLYHFGSREGLLAAIVGVVEARQRQAMAEMAAGSASPRELMVGLWNQVSSPELRPFVRLFFEVFALATHGAADTEELLAGLTTAWLDDAVRVAHRLGVPADPAAMRLAVAATRGLLLDLLAGASHAEVTASYELLVRLVI